MWKDRPIPFYQSAGNRFITNKALVNKKILPIAGRPALARCRYESIDLCDKFSTAAYRQQAVEKSRTEYLKCTFAQVPGGGDAKDFPAIVRERKCDLRMCESVVRGDAGEMIILGRFRPHKFTAGGRVVKEISNGDGRSCRTCGVLYIKQPTAFDGDSRRRIIVFYLRRQFDFAYRCDRGERFTAKTERRYRRQIFKRAYLRSGVAFEG